MIYSAHHINLKTFFHLKPASINFVLLSKSKQKKKRNRYEMKWNDWHIPINILSNDGHEFYFFLFFSLFCVAFYLANPHSRSHLPTPIKKEEETSFFFFHWHKISLKYDFLLLLFVLFMLINESQMGKKTRESNIERNEEKFTFAFRIRVIIYCLQF